MRFIKTGGRPWINLNWSRKENGVLASQINYLKYG